MVIYYDPRCADYGSSMRPEQPARVTRSVSHLKAQHPEWIWKTPPLAADTTLLLAHTLDHLKRLQHPPDFDDDTPFFPAIDEHARRAVGSALAAAELALRDRVPAFSLMRPPGHHATADAAMGFCYLNQIAVVALALRAKGMKRVAIWDFDAHHGNGTEALVRGKTEILFSSVHQFPGYPGTGATHHENCRNYPVPPHAPRQNHLAALQKSWADVIEFRPEMILVSAGFDAYVGDPITAMTLEESDFAELGRWLARAPAPCAAILEGGYSEGLPQLIDSFLTAWDQPLSLDQTH